MRGPLELLDAFFFYRARPEHRLTIQHHQLGPESILEPITTTETMFTVSSVMVGGGVVCE